MHEDKLLGFHPLSSMSDVYQDRRDAKKFTVVTDTEVLVFKCLSMADAEDWVDALRPFVSPVGGKSNRFSTVETLSGKISKWRRTRKYTASHLAFSARIPKYVCVHATVHCGAFCKTALQLRL